MSFLSINSAAQEPGSGYCLAFTGTEYVDIGTATNSMTLPVTICAWVRPQSFSAAACIFNSNNVNSNSYTGFWLQMTNGSIHIAYGDNTVTNSSGRRSKTAMVNATPGRWIHVTGVIRSALDMDIYVNGVNVGGSYSGSGGAMVNSSGSGFIGRGYGSQGWQNYFEGAIDELSVWSKALSAVEIQNLVCRKLTGNETQLVTYYRMDEGTGVLVTNGKPGVMDATVVNSPLWNRSGAALGDMSYHNYSGSSSVNLFSTVLNQGLKIEVENVSPSAKGIQIYEVTQPPNSTNGLPFPQNVTDYFGVFICDETGANISYDLKIENQGGAKIYGREKNDDQVWVLKNSITQNNHEVVIGENNRQEYWVSPFSPCNIEVDLGPDIVKCEIDSVVLQPLSINPNYTYTWSNGTVGPAIIVNQPGFYSVRGDSGSCSDTDSVWITETGGSGQLAIPTDTALCKSGGGFLELNYPGYQFLWPDGSIANGNRISSSGYLNLTIFGPCDTSAHQIYVDLTDCDCRILMPDAFTPNGDHVNDSFVLKADCELNDYHMQIFNRWGQMVFESRDIANSWNGNVGDEEAPVGVYIYKLEYKGRTEKQKLSGQISLLR